MSAWKIGSISYPTKYICVAQLLYEVFETPDLAFYFHVVLFLPFLYAGIVTERIREAYQDEFAPRMIIFPGYILNTVTSFKIHYFCECNLLSLQLFRFCLLVNCMPLSSWITVIDSCQKIIDILLKGSVTCNIVY